MGQSPGDARPLAPLSEYGFIMSSITDNPPSPEQLFKFSPYFAHVNKSLASRPGHLKNPDLQRLKTIKPTLHRSLAALTATQNRTFKNTLTERWAAHGAV
ncbi:MAG: hypothetical protein J6A65_15995, partial [Pseudomonas sp.]|nr:hypothetical protein [Pseudomonas sp.]